MRLSGFISNAGLARALAGQAGRRWSWENSTLVAAVSNVLISSLQD